jgi:predicted porin
MLALAAGTAAAQNVTLFGIIDLGVEVVDNVGAASSRLARMPSLSNTVSSRIGVRVQEDLGDGLGAFAVVEMGFAPDTGTQLQGGRGYGRQSLVGLSTRYGSLSLGRQYTMLFWSILEADILGPNIYGTGSLDAGIPNARTDNTLAWRHTLAGWTVGASYSFGRDVVNAGPSPAGTNCPGESATDSRACRAWSWLVKYDTPRWGFALADDRQRGREVGAAPDVVFGGLDRSSKVDRRLSVNGYVRSGAMRLAAGLVRRSNDGDAIKPDSKLWYLGAAYPLRELLLLDGEWVGLRHDRVDGWDASLLALRATYTLSRRTAVYVQGAHIRNQRLSALSVSAGAGGSNPAPGGSQNAINAGIRHAF